MRTLMALATLFVAAGSAAAADLQLSIDGLRNETGNLSICLFREPQSFPDCSAAPNALKRTVPVGAAFRPIVFRDLKPGAYAITVLHDENADGRLDTSLLGIPKEGVGITNNRLPRFSAPSFADAGFQMPAGRRQSVTLVYW